MINCDQTLVGGLGVDVMGLNKCGGSRELPFDSLYHWDALHAGHSLYVLQQAGYVSVTRLGTNNVSAHNLRLSLASLKPSHCLLVQRAASRRDRSPSN